MTNDRDRSIHPQEPDLDEFETVPLDEVMRIVDQLDSADPGWVDLQWHAADALHDLYLEDGVASGLNEAIRRGQLAIAAQNGQSAAHLHDLALMLWDRYEATHHDNDLEEYIHLLETALALLDRDDIDTERRAQCQANLATGLVSHSRYEAADEDIDRAVALWETALVSGQLDADAQSGIAANLAQALSREGASEHDLRRAVSYGRQSLQVANDDPEAAAHNEFAVAAALASLHNVVEDEGLLGEATDHVRRGLNCLGPTHPDAPGFTANLIGLLRQEARETNDAAPLAEAVRLARGTLAQTSDGDPDRVLILTTAAAAISEASVQNDDLSLLEEALALYRHAVAMAPDMSHEQGVALINMASVCRDGNERLDAPDLVDEGIDAGERALSIFLEPGLRRAAALTATSNCLRDRFILAGEVATLDCALSYAENALTFTPERHPERAARLTNLAVLLSDEFAERADRAQLDRAIVLYREALDASERVGVRVPERLNDLALALRDRSRDAGNADDLNEAVDLAESALAGSRPGLLTWAGYANNLGNALAERYELDGNPDDLNRVVELFRKALADATGRVHECSGYATNLGLALATRAKVTGNVADFDEALLNLSRSIDLLPAEHPDRAYRLSNLADTYRQRSIMFDDGGRTERAGTDAVAAVDTAEDAVMAARASDARLLPALSNLAEALRWRRSLTPGSTTAARIIEVQRRAATLVQITPAEKFGQAGRWARDAQDEGALVEALEAYGLAVIQTTEVAWIGLSVAERLDLLREMNEVLTRAVACAVRAGEPWTAVAWADHVRSVLWRQGLQATALSTGRNDARLAGLSGLDHEPAGEAPSVKRHRRERLRQLAHTERDALRVAIATAEDYQSLAFPGVIVLLVPGEDTSCAVLMREHEAPRLVNLARAPRGELIVRIETLGRASVAFGDNSGPAHELRARHAIFDCLDWLWDAVASPILDEIAFNADERPQVWWSPVGEFALLPLHAAGHHPRKSGQYAPKNLSAPDRARSSYLPIILAPRSRTPRAPAAPGTLLYVSANDASGGLIHLEEEQEAIRSAVQRIPIGELTEQDATVTAVREAISHCSYLHISAHGSTTAEDSLQVGFQLSDGVFTLRDLARCRADTGMLAVLLTCGSATGDNQFPNEALHVAGAAQQAGFPDVIAATLPVRDASSVPVVHAIYRAIDAAPDSVSEVVPTALDAVVETLRRDPRTSPDPLSWVPYAHFRAGLTPHASAEPDSAKSVLAI
ncbi:CHAT domain-containing protein [Sinomonas cyclohexanicum]|uniref:CHAT domain-containing protein n=1 Tax=Sinomonas cyclohexanicum TaxID=322009 RepID=A0ABN6FJP6_SINCY|nr:CHAT domain-containing protein [Corynebacterium cyclohexanicum]BCT77107.1 CHAT domain-containing protein [Corynebacterium cyclohexanicum]